MKNKGFTLVELIAVLIILAIISLIVAPLILNTVRRVKNDTNKRSIDGYGRAAQYAISNYELKQLPYPESFDELEIDYHGNKVECETSRINPDHTIYLSKCKVNGKLVKDDKNKDGYYHFGTLKMTNQEYVDTYGKKLEDALKNYHDEHNEYPSDYTTLVLEELDKDVACNINVNCDGTFTLSSCSVNDEIVDGYVYGELPKATTCLFLKANAKSITNYTDGDKHEMYTFDHTATEQTGALTDYRYIGDVPNNYVTFNNEMWRVIGVFEVEDKNGNKENRIKLIREEKLSSNMSWDSGNKNEWLTSSLNTYLNEEYYNSINENSKSLIGESKYYLGAIGSPVNNSPTIYSRERGTEVYTGNSIYVINKIALMYPSDYTYTYAYGVDSKCYNNVFNCYTGNPANGWIFNSKNSSTEWLLSPRNSNDNTSAVSETNNGRIGYSGASSVTSLRSVRPVVYLKTNVKIKSGDGSIDSPYKFEL